jgi:peptidoglycan/LPS O-acetylase OafA/YrhL
MKDGYIKSLDGVRAIAIILVMSFHSGLNYFGWMGVQLFFVLSGFLITGILWKEKFKEDSVGQKLKRFWARRSLRIFPLYFGYLLIIGIFFLASHFPVYYPTYAPYLFTYTFNYTRLLASWQGNPLFTHLWSLSIEEQFYVFFPLIVFLLPKKFVKYFLAAVIFLSPLFRFLLGEYYSSKTSMYIAADAVYWNTLSHLDAFFLGGIIPVLAFDKRIKKPVVLLAITFGFVIVAGLANYFTAHSIYPFLMDFGYNHDVIDNYAHVWKYTVLNLFFASFILCLANTNAKTSLLQKICENKLLVRIGRVSYGMYIFHWALLVYFVQHIYATQNPVSKFLVFIPYLGLTYGFAELSYRVYESKFLILKDKLFPKKKIEKSSIIVVNK